MKMGKHKSCGEDEVVVEMIQALDDPAFEVLAELFRREIAEGGETRKMSWEMHMVALLKKVPGTAKACKLRPIAALPIVHKIFSATLKVLTGDALQVLSAPQFAFRAGHQAHEVVFNMRNLVEKHEE